MRPHVRRWPSPSAGRACPVPGFGAGRTPRAGGVRGANRGARKTDRRGDAAHPTGSPPEREAAARLRLRIGRFSHAGVPRNGKSRKKSRSGQRRCGFCRTVFPAAKAPGNHACGLSSPAVNIRRTPLRSENPIFCNGNARTVRFFCSWQVPFTRLPHRRGKRPESNPHRVVDAAWAWAGGGPDADEGGKCASPAELCVADPCRPPPRSASATPRRVRRDIRSAFRWGPDMHRSPAMTAILVRGADRAAPAGCHAAPHIAG